MRRQTQILAGTALCGLLLWIAFRGTDWGALWQALRQVNAGWVAFSLLLTFASQFTRVQRWSHIVRASHPATFRSMFSATQISLLVNCVVPARLGDLVRGYVLSARERLPLASSLTLVGLDRINDVLALLAVLLIAILTFPVGSDITFAAGAFGNAEPITVSSTLMQPVALGLAGVVLVMLLVLVVLYFQQARVTAVMKRLLSPFAPRLAAWLDAVFLNFAAGMHVFRSPWQMALAIIWSLVTWGLVAGSLAALFEGFQLEYAWYGPFLMLAILGIATSVTVTPGMIGQYHIPVVASLLMLAPGMNVEQAKAFAIVAHLVALLPPIALGAYCMVGERLNLRELISGAGSAVPGARIAVDE